MYIYFLCWCLCLSALLSRQHHQSSAMSSIRNSFIGTLDIFEACMLYLCMYFIVSFEPFMLRRSTLELFRWMQRRWISLRWLHSSKLFNPTRVWCQHGWFKMCVETLCKSNDDILIYITHAYNKLIFPAHFNAERSCEWDFRSIIKYSLCYFFIFWVVRQRIFYSYYIMCYR